VRIQIRLLAAAGLGFALAACDPTLGLGLPSERVLEDGAANTLTQAKGFDINGTYSTSAGELWAIDVQLVRPNTERATASTGDQKVEAIILGETAYFRGQKFLAARMGSDPLSQNLVKAAGSSWRTRQRFLSSRWRTWCRPRTRARLPARMTTDPTQSST